MRFRCIIFWMSVHSSITYTIIFSSNLFAATESVGFHIKRYIPARYPEIFSHHQVLTARYPGIPDSGNTHKPRSVERIPHRSRRMLDTCIILIIGDVCSRNDLVCDWVSSWASTAFDEEQAVNSGEMNYMPSTAVRALESAVIRTTTIVICHLLYRHLSSVLSLSVIYFYVIVIYCRYLSSIVVICHLLSLFVIYFYEIVIYCAVICHLLSLSIIYCYANVIYCAVICHLLCRYLSCIVTSCLLCCHLLCRYLSCIVTSCLLCCHLLCRYLSSIVTSYIHCAVICHLLWCPQSFTLSSAIYVASSVIYFVISILLFRHLSSIVLRCHLSTIVLPSVIFSAGICHRS